MVSTGLHGPPTVTFDVRETFIGTYEGTNNIMMPYAVYFPLRVQKWKKLNINNGIPSFSKAPPSAGLSMSAFCSLNETTLQNY